MEWSENQQQIAVFGETAKKKPRNTLYPLYLSDTEQNGLFGVTITSSCLLFINNS